MSVSERRAVSLREIMTGVLALVTGTLALKYADLPVRVSVLETQQAAIMLTLNSIDKKLDIVLSGKQ